MSFVVIEGLDGAGKSTQIGLLQDFLDKGKVHYRYLHFPRTDAPYFGELIARFLRGEFGDLHSVDPYLIALIYGGDRKDASAVINTWLEEGFLVIADRYVHSNIAFQCAKLEHDQPVEKLRNWILDLEYNYFQIPRPDLSLFLDVPTGFTEEKLSRKRSGTDRRYLNGKQDIHEKHLDFQKRVRSKYLSEVERDPDFYLVDCRRDNDSILPQGQIFTKILKILQERKIL